MPLRFRSAWPFELRQQVYLGFCIGSRCTERCIPMLDYIYRGRPVWWRRRLAELFRQLQILKERPPKLFGYYESCEEGLHRLFLHKGILVPSDISSLDAGKYLGRQTLIRFPHGESHLERGLPEILDTLRSHNSIPEIEVNAIANFVRSCDLWSNLLSSDLADKLKSWSGVR